MNRTQNGRSALRLSVVGAALLVAASTSAYFLSASAGSRVLEKETSIYDALPGQALLHVSFAGMRSGEKCKNTALGRICSDPAMQEFLKPLMSMGEGAIGNAAEELQQQIGLSKQDVMDALWNGLSLTIVDVNPESFGQGPPDVDAILALDLSKNVKLTDKLSGMLENMLKNEVQMPVETVDVAGYAGHSVDIDGLPAYWVAADRWILAGTKLETLASVCGRIKAGSSAGSLKENKDFVRCWKATAPGNDPMLFGYLDLGAVMGMVDGSGVFEEMPPIRQIVETIGLFDMRGVAYGFSQEGQGFVDRYFAGFNPGSKSIIGGMKHNNNGLRTIALAPKDAWLYSGAVFPWTSLVPKILDGLADFDADMGAMVNEEIANIEKQLGFSLRNDVLPSLGDEYAVWMGAAPFGGMIPEIVVAHSVRDAAKLSACIDRAIAGTNTMELFGGFEFAGHKIGYFNSGRMINPPGSPGFGMKPCWTMHDGFLYVTLAPQTMKNLLVSLKSGRPGLNTNADFTNCLAQLRQTDPEAGKDSAAYVDLGRFLTMAIDTGIPVLQSMQMPQEVPVDFAMFPTTDLFQRNLFGMVASSTIETDGATNAIYSPMGYLPTFVILGAGIGATTAFMVERDMRAFDEPVMVEPVPDDEPMDDQSGEDKKDDEDDR